MKQVRLEALKLAVASSSGPDILSVAEKYADYIENGLKNPKPKVTLKMKKAK